MCKILQNHRKPISSDPISMLNPNSTRPEFNLPLLGESDSPVQFQSCIDDTVVEETEWPDEDVVSAMGPAGDGFVDLRATTLLVEESTADLARLSSKAISWSQNPNFERSSKFTARRVRSRCREFIDGEGWPGVADTYESDGDDESGLLADDAIFATPQKTGDVEAEKSEQHMYVYDLNGVAIDMSGVHPWAHKMLLSQYRSDDYGKLPPKAVMEMWKDWFPL